MATQNNM